MKRQQRTRPAPHPRQLHEEAFDLYCAGLSCPQVGAALRKRHGADAPHGSTIKRWMVQDRWPSRRQAIHQHAARLNDRLRATGDAMMMPPPYRTVATPVLNPAASPAEGGGS